MGLSDRIFGTGLAEPRFIMNDQMTTNPAEWVDSYGSFLFNFAIGQIRNTSEAEDLVQETFLGALKSRDRFSGQCSERTWLVSILRHKICDRLRAETRHPQVGLAGDHPDAGRHTVDESLVWLYEAAEECVGPERRMELHEFRAALESALNGLPARIAQAFRLHEIEERSGNEVCEALSISEGNLWVMLHRARAQLRKSLAPAWGAAKE